MEASATRPLGENFQANNLPDSVDVLARWPWVDKTVIQSIADGEFDINSLPKLHREEAPRTRYTWKSTEGYHLPLDGGKAELVIGPTKMQSAFKDLPTFLSAWLIYVAIRQAFSPAHGSPLTSWTERVIYYSQAGIPFPSILRYAIAYFQNHQQRPANSWYDIDAELVAIHFTVGIGGQQQRPMSPTKPFLGTKVKIPLTQQICENYNKESGCKIKETIGRDCLRKHICLLCEELDHRAFECTHS